MGGDSSSEDCWFESQHNIVDGHFRHKFVSKIVMLVWKDKNKWKRGRGWAILKKEWIAFQNAKRKKQKAAQTQSHCAVQICWNWSRLKLSMDMFVFFFSSLSSAQKWKHYNLLFQRNADDIIGNVSRPYLPTYLPTYSLGKATYSRHLQELSRTPWPSDCL